MIDTLYLKEHNNTFKQYTQTENKKNKFQFKKINIFVGENNSGKSRFMRELFLSFRQKEVKNEKYYNSINIPFISENKAKEEFNVFLSSYLKISSNDGRNNAKETVIVNSFISKIVPDIESNLLSFDNYARILDEFDFLLSGDNKLVGEYNNTLVFLKC